MTVDEHHFLWEPDGRALITALRNGGPIERRERLGESILTTYRAEPGGRPLAVSPDRRAVFVTSADRMRLRPLGLLDGRPIGPFVDEDRPFVQAVVSPDSALVLTSTEGARVRFRDAVTGRVIGPAIMLRGAGGVTGLAFRPTGGQAALGWANLIQLVDVPEPMSGEPDEIRRRIEHLTKPGIDQGR